jgi:hypothetical protein
MDPNISEKLIESVTNIMKKTILFEKTERIQGIFIGLTICTSIFGFFTIYNTYRAVITENKLNTIERLVKENSHLPKVYYKILLDCQNKVNNMNEIQNNMDIKIKDISKNVTDLIKEKME